MDFISNMKCQEYWGVFALYRRGGLWPIIFQVFFFHSNYFSFENNNKKIFAIRRYEVQYSSSLSHLTKNLGSAKDNQERDKRKG